MTHHHHSQRCVIKAPKKVQPFNEFVSRIRKSFYYGYGSNCESMCIPGPLAQYTSERYSENHRGTSLNRLSKIAVGSTQCNNPCSLIMALIYLDRLNSMDPNYVRRITPHDLFIISMMVSTKLYAGNDEICFDIKDWTKYGMNSDRLKKLELEFLYAIDWNIYISNEEFFDKLESIEKDLALRQGIGRGWLTYTELINFLPSFTIAKFLINNITLLTVSYCASIMTIAGAFFLVSNIPGNGLLKINREKFRNDKNTLNQKSNADKISTNTDDLLMPLEDETEIQHKNYSTIGLNIEKELEKIYYNLFDPRKSKTENDNILTIDIQNNDITKKGIYDYNYHENYILLKELEEQYNHSRENLDWEELEQSSYLEKFLLHNAGKFISWYYKF